MHHAIRLTIAFIVAIIFWPLFAHASSEPDLSVERSFPPYYLEHKQYFAPQIIKLDNQPVWVLRNLGDWAANATIIEGPTGLIVYDTGVNTAHGALIKDAIADISDKPIVAIVYSHHHADHVGGAGALVSSEAVKTGDVKIIAWHNLVKEYTDENLVVGPIMGLRAIYMYGAALPPEENVHQGCCGKSFIGGQGGFLPPNVALSEDTDMTLGGLPVRFFHTGGESASEIGLFIPSMKVALLADEFYPALANLYTIRGAKFRNASKWANAGMKALQFDPEWLLGSHALPIRGKAEIERVLFTYHDSILFMHDQAVRYILKGYTAEELQAKFTELPSYLDQPPFTRPMYGTVPFNTATQYIGYLGLYQGDPIQFQQTPGTEKAKRLVKLMGGRDQVYEEALKSYRESDFQWSAELTTYLIKISNDDLPARKLKAAGLRQLGYSQLNPQWRNWYLTAAMELDGTLNLAGLQQVIAMRASSESVPMHTFLNGLRYKVDPEIATDREQRIGISVDGGEQQFILQLRNSVLTIDNASAETLPATQLQGTSAAIKALFAGLKTASELTAAGLISTAGNNSEAEEFLACLDLKPSNVNLTVR